MGRHRGDNDRVNCLCVGDIAWRKLMCTTSSAASIGSNAGCRKSALLMPSHYYPRTTLVLLSSLVDSRQIPALLGTLSSDPFFAFWQI